MTDVTIQYAYLPETYRPDTSPTIKIADLPLKERPTQRLYHYGGGALNTREVLAVIVGGPHQWQIAGQLLVSFQTLATISRASTSELVSIPNLGRAGAARLKAALELGRRLATESQPERKQIRSAADAAEMLQLDMSLLDHEELRLMIMDTKNRVTALPTLYKGSANTAVVRIGEIIREVLRHNGIALILLHNHPSGDPTPSPEDVQLTKRLVAACKLTDIDILDHIIIGQGRYVSLKERRLGFD